MKLWNTKGCGDGKAGTGATRAWPVVVHIAAFAVSIALPVLAVAGAAIWRLNVAERVEVEHRVTATARALAIDLDRELTQYITTLAVLATSPSLRAGDLRTFEDQARQAVRGRDWYLVLSDETGQQLINTLVPTGSVLPPLRVPDGVQTVRETKRPYVSNLFEGRIAQRPIMVVLFPVIEAEAVRYVLVLGMEPKHLLPLFERSNHDSRWRATIVDRQGVVLARSTDHQQWSGRQIDPDTFKAITTTPTGIAQLRSLTGTGKLTGWHHSSISNWVVSVSVPGSVLSAPLERAWLGFGIGSTALILLAGLLAFYFGRQIARPIYALSRVAAGVGERPFAPTHLKEANEAGAALVEATRKLRVSEARFRTLAERARDIVLLLNADGTILEANAAAVKAYGYGLEELIGQSVVMLREPATRAEVDWQLVQAMTAGVLFETLHQRKDGSIFPVEVSAASAQVGDERLIFSIIRDISRRKRGEAAVRDREALLQTVTQNVGVGLVLLDMQRRYTFVNPACAELLRRPASEILGRTVAEVLGPLYDHTCERLDKAYCGEQVSYEFNETVAADAPDASERMFQITYQPARDPLGRITGMIGVIVDITGPKRDAEHIRFLMRELSHRSKNLLAVIQAMARQTSRTSESLTDFEDRFGWRIMGLARSHDLLVQQNWQGVPLVELIRTQLTPFVDPFETRVGMRGAPLMLRPEAANNLGLALHELATNASKYGALSTPRGRVGLAWEIDQATPRMFRMSWRETDGPPVKPPRRTGFGQQVVEQIVAVSLSGTATLEFRPEGLMWQLEAPLAGIAQGA